MWKFSENILTIQYVDNISLINANTVILARVSSRTRDWGETKDRIDTCNFISGLHMVFHTEINDI